MRRWELVAAGSAKFWEVGLTGAVATVRFGRLGAAGQTQVKELASEAAAEAHVAKLVAEKEKKGYRPVAASEAPPAGTARDEDTWVMPAAWLRDVVRRRGLEPLPKFKLDSRRARELRDWVASDHSVIAEVLEDPRTDRGLAQALRDQLGGRPSPLGAAALASAASLHKATVHWLIAEHGLPFAAAAVAHRTTMFFGRARPDLGSWVQKAYLQPFPDHRVYLDHVDAANLVLVRSALAVADAETHAAAVEALEEVGTTRAGQMARAFLAPSRHDWFEEAKAHSPARGRTGSPCAR
ncbi:WGR domain-containing protein [Lentzea sp. DG1S-22]|uniref:WGR domain-containing protein n=1 Tax=Lentzea sp. DG1S-22 TaxID=3108822 RepID=UPI002E766CED|nr:WGR domain-containing protein [Lentzea sp. DG1S-22]WVH83768.1 WGR domain-containing protein [Lentzea sp. DG1S-22]